MIARVLKPQGKYRVARAIAEMKARHGLADLESQRSAERQTFASDPDAEEGRKAIRLCFLIYDVARLHRAAYDEFMKPLGINRMQWLVLAELSRCDGMTQTALSKLLDSKKANAGVVIASLESAGWVERRDDPQDRRAKRVYLVPAAHGVIRQMSILADQFGNKILRSLSKAERDELGRSLARIKNDMK